MSFQSRLLWVPLALNSLIAPWMFSQTTNSCLDLPTREPICSATGINRSCNLYIDRLRPVAPPTVYLRRGDIVTVHVINASPFETLSLDFKTAGDTTPPDPFATGFQAVNATVTKLTVVDYVEYFGLDTGGQKLPPDPFQQMRTKLKQVATTQRILFSEYDPSIVMNEILLATQPPAASACTAALAWDDKGYPNPWLSPGTWASAVTDVLQALEGASPTPNEVATRVRQLDSDIAALVAYKPPATTPSNLLQTWTTAVDKIQKRQSQLDDWRDNPPDAPPPPTLDIDKALIKVIENLKLKSFTPMELKETIIDLSPADRNVTAETWSLDYLNKLQGAVKSTTSPTPIHASDILTSPPSTTAIASVNVTYQRPPRLEFATGVMTPVRSYHSYSSAEAASGGTVTGNVVQESKTYTVLPMAMTNVVLGQGIVAGVPMGSFLTIGVGYNPVISSIEFGVGPSFSYRSVVVSALADIGQDTHLADGFAVGQSLANNNTKPLTSSYWFARPAFGLSVRIPLSGGQSASPGSGGSTSGGSGGKH